MAKQKTRKSPPPPPDGEPKETPADRDTSSRSRVSEVQDPLISGDAGRKASSTVDVAVDEGGQIARRKPRVDLLH